MDLGSAVIAYLDGRSVERAGGDSPKRRAKPEAEPPPDMKHHLQRLPALLMARPPSTPGKSRNEASSAQCDAPLARSVKIGLAKALVRQGRQKLRARKADWGNPDDRNNSAPNSAVPGYRARTFPTRPDPLLGAGPSTTREIKVRMPGSRRRGQGRLIRPMPYQLVDDRPNQRCRTRHHGKTRLSSRIQPENLL